MKLRNFILISFSLTLSILLMSFEVLACKCGPKPTVLEAFEGSEMVIIGKVVSVELFKGSEKIDFEAERKRTGYDNSEDFIKSTRMIVEKVYKGNVKVGDELTFGQHESSCTLGFKINSVGQKYLFYLDDFSKGRFNPAQNEKDGKPVYYWQMCGRSDGIGKFENDDLKYLNKIDQVKGKTRISGELDCWNLPCSSIANVTIKIISEKKTYEIRTDEHGVYEIYDLPPGKYILEPEIPIDWKIHDYTLRISPIDFEEINFDSSRRLPVVLEANKHTGIDFYFELVTAISGKVLSPEGKPMRGVCVRAVSSELKVDNKVFKNCTDENGVFLIQEMPQGKYVLVANEDNKLSGNEPFNRIYYPNVNQQAQAQEVFVKLGQPLDNLIIQVPKTKDRITIQGRLTYSDGKPVVNKRVEFNVDKENINIDGQDSTQTDKNGEFSLQVLKGYKGYLVGTMETYLGEFKECPKLDSLIKELAGSSINSRETVLTKGITIKANRDISNLQLKFDFPSCEKAKE